MRKLNIRWLVGIVLGSIGLAIFGFVLHEFQMSRNAPSFLREAKRAQAADRPADAADYLRRYVKLAPNDNEALILYGFQLADLNKVAGAYFTLEKALRNDPDRSEVHRRLVELAMKLGRFSDAMDHLSVLLKESPNDAELLEQLSECQLKKGDFKDAAASLELAIASSPQRVLAYVNLANLLLEKLDRASDATETIHQMVSNNPESSDAYLYRGQWSLQRAKQLSSSRRATRESPSETPENLRTSAEADAKHALALAPDGADAMAFATAIEQAAGRIDEARKIAQHGIDLYKDKPRFYMILADIESMSGNRTEAVDLLRRSIEVAPDETGLKWILANYLIDQADFDEASKLIEQLREAKHSESSVNYLDARITFGRNQWSEAIQQFEKIRPSLSESPDLQKQADLWLGLAYREINSPDQQMLCFRRAIALDPDWPPARLALAESLVSANLLQEAILEYQQVRQNPEAPKVGALGLARAVLLANVRQKKTAQNWEEFDEILNQFEKTESSEPQIAILRMEQLLASEQREAANKVITEARQKNPDRIELWNAEIGLAITNQDWDLVDRLLQETDSQFGDTPQVRLLRGRSLVLRQQTEAKDRLQKLAEPPVTWTEQQRLQLAADFARLFLSIEAYDETEKLAAEVANADPTDLRIRLLTMEVALRTKRADLLEDTLKDVKRLSGKDGPMYLYGDAVRLNLLGKESEALEKLKRARQQRPTWVRIPLLQAEIHERLKQTPAAIEQYLEAIRLGERAPNVTSRVLTHLFNERRFEEADKLIRKLKESPNLITDDLARYEVIVSLERGDKDHALAAVQAMVNDSERSQDPMWLGQVYATLEKYSNAEEQFQRARTANPQDPKPWVALVRLLVLAGKLAQAEATIEEAKSSIAPDDVMVAAGQCYVFLGDMKRARACYQSALEQFPTNAVVNRTWIEFLLKANATQEAEVALRKLLKASNGNDESSRENRQWAQRRLAMTLLAQGSYEQLTEALDLVELNLVATNSKSSDDSRMKALILSKRSSRTDRENAIAILEKLLAQDAASPASLEDRFLLSKLYAANGDRAKARTELRKIIVARKNDPRILSSYVRLCLQSEEVGDAELYFDRLQKAAPNDMLTLDLQTQFLFRKGKYSETLELLRRIGTKALNADAKLELVAATKLWCAQRLDNFANQLEQASKAEEAKTFNNEAEAFYQQFTEIRPDDILVLAEFLARKTQINRALDLLQERMGKSSIDGVIGLAMAVKNNPAADAGQLKRLQDLLNEGMKNHDPSLRLALISADLMSWRGDDEGASTLYRELLKRDDRNVAALNNLAVLLSTSGGDLNLATKLIENAIKLGGPLDALYDTQGLVKLAKGNAADAVLDFQQALTQNETAVHRFHHALALAQTQQFSLASSSMERADALQLAEHKLHPHERNALAKLRAQLKNYNQAK